MAAAAKEVGKLTGGSLDYLINNAAYVSHLTVAKFIDEFADDEAALDEDLNTAWNTNVIGVINTINTFLPLLKKGTVKKVVTLSSGLGDLDVTTGLGIWEHAPYGISKAAVNIVSAKYGARYTEEGILFLAISPGVVDTGAAAGMILWFEFYFPLTHSSKTTPTPECLFVPFYLYSSRYRRPLPKVPEVGSGFQWSYESLGIG